MTDFGDFRTDPDDHPAGGFAMMANHWFRDPRLSDKAKGRLGYLATHAASYRVTMEQQIAETRDGRDAVYASIRELIELGYLERRRERDEGGRITGVYCTWGPASRVAQYARAWGRPDTTVPGQAGSGKPADGSTTSGQASSGRASSGEADTKKTNLLEDQEKEDQPPPPDPPPTPEPDPAEEEEGSSTEPSPAARAALRAVLAAGHARRGTVTGRRAAELASRLDRKLAAGWTHDQIVDALAEPLETVESTAAVLRWRISQHLDGPPPPVPIPAPRPAPVERCSCLRGIVLVPNPDDPRRDRPVPCPRCRPDEASAA